MLTVARVFAVAEGVGPVNVSWKLQACDCENKKIGMVSEKESSAPSLGRWMLPGG